MTDFNFGFNDDSAYEYCYATGNYEDQFCDLCPHKGECSGSGSDEEDFD